MLFFIFFLFPFFLFIIYFIYYLLFILFFISFVISLKFWLWFIVVLFFFSSFFIYYLFYFLLICYFHLPFNDFLFFDFIDHKKRSIKKKSYYNSLFFSLILFHFQKNKTRRIINNLFPLLRNLILLGFRLQSLEMNLFYFWCISLD